MIRSAALVQFPRLLIERYRGSRRRALTLIQAFGINDHGEIAGLGQLVNGDVHETLLVPCDGNHPSQCDDYSKVEGDAPEPTRQQ